MKIYNTNILSLFILILCFWTVPQNDILASAVPIITNKVTSAQKDTPIEKKKKTTKRSTRKIKKQKKDALKFRKKFKTHATQNNEHNNGFSWAWFILSWYVLFTTLLIIGVVMAISFMWITALILLILPIVVAIIFLIILAVGLNSVSLC